MGMAKALKHMHDNRIMHRDLKPDNIMMRSKDSMSPVIIDFGLSANSDSDDYIFYKSGSPGYIAPEIFTL
jgi:serine/threonine protein kinase